MRRGRHFGWLWWRLKRSRRQATRDAASLPVGGMGCWLNASAISWQMMGCLVVKWWPVYYGRCTMVVLWVLFRLSEIVGKLATYLPLQPRPRYVECYAQGSVPVKYSWVNTPKIPAEYEYLWVKYPYSILVLRRLKYPYSYSILEDTHEYFLQLIIRTEFRETVQFSLTYCQNSSMEDIFAHQIVILYEWINLEVKDFISKFEKRYVTKNLLLKGGILAGRAYSRTRTDTRDSENLWDEYGYIV